MSLYTKTLRTLKTPKKFWFPRPAVNMSVWLVIPHQQIIIVVKFSVSFKDTGVSTLLQVKFRQSTAI